MMHKLEGEQIVCPDCGCKHFRIVISANNEYFGIAQCVDCNAIAKTVKF